MSRIGDAAAGMVAFAFFWGILFTFGLVIAILYVIFVILARQAVLYVRHQNELADASTEYEQALQAAGWEYEGDDVFRSVFGVELPGDNGVQGDTQSMLGALFGVEIQE